MYTYTCNPPPPPITPPLSWPPVMCCMLNNIDVPADKRHRPNVGPPSTKLAQHWTNIRQMSRVCWEAELTASECYVTVLCHASSAEPALARRWRSWQYSRVITALTGQHSLALPVTTTRCHTPKCHRVGQ